MFHVLNQRERSAGDVKVLQGLHGKKVPMTLNRAESALMARPQAPSQMIELGAVAPRSPLVPGLVIGGVLVAGLLGFVMWRTYSLDMKG